MRTIEIVDDAGDEFSVMNIPIPFYIRCKLNTGLTKYRVKIVDRSDHLRGFYTGASKRDFLELHVPVIPLQNYGKLFIHIELDNDLLDDTITHETSIEYVDQETYESVTGKTKEVKPQETRSPRPIVQDTTHQLSSQEIKYLTLGEEKTEEEDSSTEYSTPTSLPSYATLSESFDADTQQIEVNNETKTESVDPTVELSPDELDYLAQRTVILQEDISHASADRIKEVTEVRKDEEE